MAIHGMFNCLCPKNAAEALDFFARAFGTREKFRLSAGGGGDRIEMAPTDQFYGERSASCATLSAIAGTLAKARKYPRKEMQKRDLMASGGS